MPNRGGRGVKSPPTQIRVKIILFPFRSRNAFLRVIGFVRFCLVFLFCRFFKKSRSSLNSDLGELFRDSFCRGGMGEKLPQT